MKSEPKLSIIIPVYNVEPYLRKCVDSVLTQDYDDFEIILVDDGSTDESGAICDEYASASFASFHHSVIPIRVIHKPNGGLSDARNAGMKVAVGEYVVFLDSDDYWSSNVLGTLMAQVKHEQLDVLRYNYQNVRISQNGEYEAFLQNKNPHYIDKRTDIVSGGTYLNERMDYAGYSVMYLMRRAIVPMFKTSIHFEDAEWMPRMMLSAERANSTPLVVYNYLMREGSISHSPKNIDVKRRNIDDMLFIIQRYNSYILQYPNCYWLRNMRSRLVVTVVANVSQYFYTERKEYIKRLRQLQVFPLSIANQGKSYIRKARLINFSPRLAIFLLHLKNG